jgi:hypothetical protein
MSRRGRQAPPILDFGLRGRFSILDCRRKISEVGAKIFHSWAFSSAIQNPKPVVSFVEPSKI